MAGRVSGVFSNVLLLALMTLGVDCQFQLSFGTPTPPAPTTPRPTLPGGYDPACKDAIGNCGSYGADACTGVYQSWARKNCEATCGFCKSLPTQPPPCVDAISNCADFQQDSCTDPKFKTWAQQNCRRHCRLCTSNQLAQVYAQTTQPTTVPPQLCVDKVDCKLYGRDACSTATYGNWGRENCALYCGFCQGIATPPPLCVDKNPNCALYQSDLCTNPSYSLFVEENCLKYCGQCSGTFGSRGKRQAGPQAPPSPPTPPTTPPLGSAPQQTGMPTTTTQNYPTPPRPTKPPMMSSSQGAGNTPAPAAPTSTPSPTASKGPTMAPSADCLDKIDDCRLYGSSGCVGIYSSWAKYNCPRYCGFCTNPNDTVKECKDNIPNCNEYQNDICTAVTFRIFAEDNCRKYCNLCDSDIRADGQSAGANQSPQLTNKATDASNDAATNTTGSSDCKDTVDYCWTEPNENCFGIYEPWAIGHCPFRCGFCPEKPKCEDVLDYCSQYDSSACTDSAFIGWARTNCRKTCNLCQVPVRPSTVSPAPGTGTGPSSSSGPNPSGPNGNTAGPTPSNPNGVTSSPGVIVTSGPIVEPNNGTKVQSGPDGNLVTGRRQTYIIQGPPAVLPGTCLYNGDSHLQDANWYDGCDYICNCIDATNNRIICTDRCTKWDSNLAINGCSWVKEAGECCQRLECSDSKK